jgi:hypothetical protein
MKKFFFIVLLIFSIIPVSIKSNVSLSISLNMNVVLKNTEEGVYIEFVRIDGILYAYEYDCDGGLIRVYMVPSD